ncbi:MAG: RNA polymerase sigma factor [Gemmatimonadota bacterium]
MSNAVAAVPHASAEDRLVAAVLRGDEAVYASLIDEYYGGMRRLALSHVHDQDLADDIIQETWIAVVNGIDRFQRRSSFKTWVYRILLNLARRKALREARYVDLPEESGLVSTAAVRNGTARTVAQAIPAEHWGPRQNPDDWIVSRELQVGIEAAVRELPLAQREVVTLRDIEGWSAEEVCELLNITGANQRVLLHRGRMAIRNKLRIYLDANET